MKLNLRPVLEVMTAFSGVLLLSSICFPQQVTIRVVNSSDGRPLAGWSVDVIFVNHTQGKDDVQGSKHLWTDANGMAPVTLPQPLPQLLNVYAFPQTEEWYPGSVKANTSVVMQKGAQSGGTEPQDRVRAEPGQILILPKRITLWDKFIRTVLGPLERG